MKSFLKGPFGIFEAVLEPVIRAVDEFSREMEATRERERKKKVSEKRKKIARTAQELYRATREICKDTGKYNNDGLRTHAIMKLPGVVSCSHTKHFTSSIYVIFDDGFEASGYSGPGKDEIEDVAKDLILRYYDLNNMSKKKEKQNV